MTDLDANAIYQLSSCLMNLTLTLLVQSMNGGRTCPAAQQQMNASLRDARNLLSQAEQTKRENQVFLERLARVREQHSNLSEELNDLNRLGAMMRHSTPVSGRNAARRITFNESSACSSAASPGSRMMTEYTPNSSYEFASGRSATPRRAETQDSELLDSQDILDVMYRHTNMIQGNLMELARATSDVVDSTRASE